MTATADPPATTNVGKPPPAWTLLRDVMFRRYWAAAGIAGAGAVLGVLWLVGSPITRMRTLPDPMQ